MTGNSAVLVDNVRYNVQPKCLREMIFRGLRFCWDFANITSAKVIVQWKRLNRDASGVMVLSRISDYPDYPMQYLLLDMNLFRKRLQIKRLLL